jgi:hypothetical protein
MEASCIVSGVPELARSGLPMTPVTGITAAQA